MFTIETRRDRTVPGSRAFVHPPKTVNGSNEKIRNLCNKRQWIFYETACFRGDLIQMCPKFWVIPIQTGKQSLWAVNSCVMNQGSLMKSSRADSGRSKWHPGGDSLLQTSVGPGKLVPAAEHWAQTSGGLEKSS